MKPFWIIIVTFVVSAVVIGGGAYYLTNYNATQQENSLNSQISSLNTQVSNLEKEVTSDKTTTNNTSGTITGSSISLAAVSVGLASQITAKLPTTLTVTEGGKMFCSYQPLGLGVSTSNPIIYIWSYCSEYINNSGTLSQGTAGSGIDAIRYTTSGSQYSLTTISLIMDGKDDQGVAVPTTVQNASSSYSTGSGAATLQQSVVTQAKSYYGITG